MSQSLTRTVILCFDALSMTYLDEFDLPNFEGLREQGISASLRSTFPPWTGSAWPSFYTGVDPSRHGVYSFFDFTRTYPDDAPLVSRNTVRAPAVWNYLSHADLSAAVLNLPVTHPAEPINGAIIPGYLAPENAAGYPAGIRDELSDMIGEEYRIYASEETGDATTEMLKSYVDLIDLRRRSAKALLETQNPDVAILQVQKTDTVFHQFDDTRAFRRIYEAADAVVGTVLNTVPQDANVIVCSDHGIGPTHGYNLYVNEILRRAGFIQATRRGETPTLSNSKRQLTSSGVTAEGSSTVTRRVVAGLSSVLANVGIQPGDVYAATRRIGADAALRSLLPGGVTDSVGQHVDWTASQAYCRSGPELGVRINLEGREPDGVVPRQEYESVRDRVIETLSTVRTPSSDPAFDWVKRREAVYDGPYLEAACDVLFQPAEMNHIAATNLIGKRFVPIDKYNHKTDGVFIGSGPGFQPGTAIEQLSLTDVAPIVMALAGCAIPERMTGSVPSNLLAVPTTTRTYEALQYGGGTLENNDGQVEARLEDLGYL